MNIFDYLKWDRETKKEEKRLEKINKITVEISELVGEIEGFKEKANIYQKANNLAFVSNYQEQADFMFEAYKKMGKAEGLRRVLENLRS